MTDITLRQDGAGWTFTPHSAQADNFLFNEFNTIGPRNLKVADIYNIIEHAGKQGLSIRSQCGAKCFALLGIAASNHTQGDGQ